MELYDGLLPRARQPETYFRRFASVGPISSREVSSKSLIIRDRNLEKAVEDLSQLLEEPIEADTVKDLRKRIMDKTVRFNHAAKSGA
jgi:hypothetical protein